MSLTLIEVDGELYHADELYYEDGEWFDTVPVLDENYEMIPASVCLCYAFEPGECCCATTAWEDYRYDDYVEDEDDTTQTDAN